MAKQKLTTAEILARARQQGAAGAGGAEAGAESAAPPAEAAPSAEAVDTTPAEAPVKKPTAKPGSTADILAAARAGGSGAAAAKKPAAKPGSTADILAAARAGGSAGAAAKAPPKAAAAKPQPKQAAAARAGERPSVQEMVKAARQGVQAQVAPARPKLPARPSASAKGAAEAPTRRSFFGEAAALVAAPFVTGWAAMGAIAAIWGLAAARFMMPNMIVEPPTKFKIGPPSDYPPGTVSNKWKAARGIWVVNTDQYDGRNLIYALASVCTHLGCTPNWLDGEQKFKCPCHGSGFYISGINFEGPAPRPLERVGLRLAEDGTLEVDKSVKFQEELGQWQDPTSYVVSA